MNRKALITSLGLTSIFSAMYSAGITAESIGEATRILRVPAMHRSGKKEKGQKRRREQPVAVLKYGAAPNRSERRGMRCVARSYQPWRNASRIICSG